MIADPKKPTGPLGPEWIRQDRPSKVIEVSLLGLKKVEFLAHALDQMRIRRVEEHEALEVIRSPDDVGLKTRPGRERVRKWKNERTAIDVVFETRKDRILVITVIKIKKKGRPARRRRR